MICERCGKEHDGSFGSGRFCSRSCANSRIWTQEINNKRSETIKAGYKSGKIIRNKPQLGKPLTDTHKKKISDSLKETYMKDPTLRTRVGVYGDKNGSKSVTARNKCRTSAMKSEFWKYRRKHLIRYEEYTFDSTYEVEVVKSLDENNIGWEKPKSFKYFYAGKNRTYTPDFYLPDYNIYLDPKNDFLINNINPGTGFNDIDKIKAVEEQNNIRVIILDKNQLKWEVIKTLI